MRWRRAVEPCGQESREGTSFFIGIKMRHREVTARSSTPSVVEKNHIWAILRKEADPRQEAPKDRNSKQQGHRIIISQIHMLQHIKCQVQISMKAHRIRQSAITPRISRWPSFCMLLRFLTQNLVNLALSKVFAKRIFKGYLQGGRGTDQALPNRKQKSTS